MSIIHNVHIHTGYAEEQYEKILQELHSITKKLNKMAGELESLQAKADEQAVAITDLQAAVDAEQADIKALLESNATVVTDLNTQIADLKAQIAAGIDPAAITAITDKIAASTASIVTAKEDIAGTV